MAEYTDYATFTDYPIFDGDQHIYEPFESYSRYIPREFADRTLRPGTDASGATIALAEDRVVQVDNDLDKCYRPGSLKELLKGLKKGASGEDGYQWMDMDPAFQNRDLRIAQLDKQNVQATLLFPGSLGLVAEHYLEDPDLYYASSWAFLRWVEDEWGFAYQDRLFFAPVLSLRDVERTNEQLEWLIDRGARAISLVPGPAYGRSPADPHFDPFWARVNEAELVVCYHINEAVPGYKSSRSEQWGQEPYPTFFTQSAWQWMWAYGEQPALETFTALIYDNLFGRFPNIKIVSAEHGAEWAPYFVRRLDKMRGMGRNGPWIGGPLTERPSEIFKKHFRLVPYWEDDLGPVVEALGKEVLLGGSDFPHSEGLAFPTQLVEHLSMLSPEDQRFVMRDNGLALLGL